MSVCWSSLTLRCSGAPTVLRVVNARRDERCEGGAREPCSTAGPWVAPLYGSFVSAD